ncbi:MAG: WecB/TagA/CpsF family glycosyltransferase [Ignavibacteriae bacterium]|nr:WecB/TagA/CpsF family glycosyltransferase [Ignavibacteriota bacterium]NOG99441.1 WecB/TagA/CpsF family glycosyltransferase [Ignavibacteriota bacterium]
MMKYLFEPCFVNITDENEYLSKIDETIKSNSKRTFFYLNSHSYYTANKNLKFKEALNKSDFIIADGYSIVWAIKKLSGNSINKVVFTYSFFDGMKKVFEQNNANLFFLGGTSEIISKSAEVMKRKFPNLNLTDFHHGYFDKENESDSIIEKINASKANVLIVGMGLPLSELWIQENKDKINANCIFSVGGFFDVLSGSKRTSPKWLYNSGLEWVYRLFKEPGRLFGRYLRSNLFFLKKLYFRNSK